MSNAGRFKIRVASNSYPAWAAIYYDDQEIISISHSELSDLKYTVKKAMQEARNCLPEQYKGEV